MPFSSTCACGRSTDSFGGLCDRCLALQSLDLPSTATPAQIENSYRTLVKVWHPDRFQSDPKMRLAAEEKLKEINTAHEYLATDQGAATQPAQNSRLRPSDPEDAAEEPVEVAQSGNEEPEISENESKEIRRILKRQRANSISVPKIMLQMGFALGAVATIAILWFVIDAILSSNTRTGPAWDQFKTEISRDLHASGLRFWDNASENLHGQKDQGSPVAPPVPQQASPAVPSLPPQAKESQSSARSNLSGTRNLAGLPHIKIGGGGERAQSYITSGLTPMEVLAILGNPTSSSGEKMFYRGSEIDFSNGRVTGWKVDPKTSPIPVRLWPDVAPVPGLTHFGIGSTKSDVINLQGTPTLFSQNTFGYGNSLVFFEKDRVTGWKEDPDSVRLRVAH